MSAPRSLPRQFSSGAGRLLGAAAAIVFALIVQRSLVAAPIVWSDAAGIRTIDTPGEKPTLLYSTFQSRGLAIGPSSDDAKTNALYWSDVLPTVPIGGSGRISRGPLSGGSASPIVTNLIDPTGIAIDRRAGLMFWADATENTIYQARLSGGAAQKVASATYWGSMTGIAVDPASQQIYFGFVNPFIDALRAGGIGRIDYDGGNFQSIASALVEPTSVALDPVHEQVYWVDASFAGVVQRAPLSGGEPETLVSNLVGAFGLALDVGNNEMVFTENNASRNSGRISRTDLNGQNQSLLVDGLTNPTAVALITSTTPSGDLNHDGAVDQQDVTMLLHHYGETSTPPLGDLTGDGRVSLFDLAAMQRQLTIPTIYDVSFAGASVPEPSSLFLAAIAAGCATLMRARQRTRVSGRRLRTPQLRP